MPKLLIEIGTEELPLSALDVIYQELDVRVRTVLTENRIAFEEVQVEATPQRIALYIEGIAKKQTDHVLELSGPKWDQAFDREGNPTKVIKGFLKAKGATLKDVTAKETPKGQFVLVKKAEKGKSVASILPEILTQTFSSIPFPKMMRWESSGFRFPRPIRWIAALLDSKVISFELADVKSTSVSYGHRFLSPSPFKIKKADWSAYQATLKQKHVILSLHKREAIVRNKLKSGFKQKQIDEDLVHIASQLVEEPFFLQGSFDKAYLELPAEVLATCMKKNQKIFACYGPGGKLQNKFVAVLNGKRKGLPRIQFDYENVLESRLKDARYFYEADTEKSLDSKLAQLKQLTYLGKLGTMQDKCERLATLSSDLVKLAGCGILKDDLKKVARLAKADLMTQLVFEFPELQGIVGREYARSAGEKKEVASAIGTQYLPANLTEDYTNLPQYIGKLGALYGILDRFDLLVGAFGTGIEPTGSQDPFALRRAGGVLVKLIRAFGISFSFSEMIEQNRKAYGNVLEQDPKQKLLKFIGERTAFELQVKPGTRSMEIFQAVWNASNDTLADVFDRYEILMELSRKEPKRFRQAAKVVERTGNITKQATGELKIQSQLLNEPLEKKLYDLIEGKSAQIGDLIQNRDYKKATLLFGDTFYRPVHDFFDKVMVNVEDASIRANRQALMKQINQLYTSHLADLSVLSRLDEK